MRPVPYGRRDQHLAWAKERAELYLADGDAANAFASFVSDLRKHPELEQHGGIELGALLLFGGHLSTVEAVRDHIEGCS